MGYQSGSLGICQEKKQKIREELETKMILSSSSLENGSDIEVSEDSYLKNVFSDLATDVAGLLDHLEFK